MARYVQLGAAYFVGGADFTSQSNNISAESTAAEVDVSTYGDGGAKVLVGGQESVTISAGGFVDWGSDNDVARETYSNRRLVLPHTIGPSNSGAAVAASAVIVRGLTTSVKLLGAVGDALPWTVSAAGSGQMAIGAFLHAATSVDADANGTAVQVGAVPAGHRGIGALHVLSASGTTPTLNVTVESDDNASFTSATTRLTFNTASDDPTTWWDVQRTDGSAITDDYWRAVFDVDGTDPDFTAVVAFGVSLFGIA